MRNENWNERNVVVVSVRCHICNKVYAVYVTEESWNEFNSPNRRHIQDIFPYLSPEDRELLISQTCNDCWNKMFSYDEEDEEEEYTEEELAEIYSNIEEFYKTHNYVSCEELSGL